jgi:hypothetical protein
VRQDFDAAKKCASIVPLVSFGPIHGFLHFLDKAWMPTVLIQTCHLLSRGSPVRRPIP